MSSQIKYISGLDGLRCFSILFVLMEHLGLGKILHEHFSPEIADKIYLTFSGKTGVSIFFVISGYLITSILIQEVKTNGKVNFRNFFLRRFFRLFPAFAMFMLFILVFFLVINRDGSNIITAWGLSFVYLYNFVPYGVYRVPELGHTWSLAIEEQFYLIWPVIMNFFRLHTIHIILFLAAFFFILFKIVYDAMPISSIYESYRITIPGAFPVILGCITAFAGSYHATKGKFILAILGFVLFFSSLLIPSINFSVLAQFNFFVQPIGIALIINYITKNKEAYLVSFLEINLFVWIGRLSYSIYLWQGLFLKNGPGSTLWIQQFPQNLFLTAGCAVISFYFIEKRFIKFKNKFRVVSVNHD